MMLGLEPRHEQRSLHVRNLAKADERLHLVALATDHFRHGAQAKDVIIGDAPEQVTVGAQPPKQPIEQRETILVRMADRQLRQLHELPRHTKRRLCWRRGGRRGGRQRRQRGEQIRLFANAPSNLVRPRAGGEAHARGLAPALEVGRVRQRRDAHQNRLSCCGFGARRAAS